jgi:hypothetical protein
VMPRYFAHATAAFEALAGERSALTPVVLVQKLGEIGIILDVNAARAMAMVRISMRHRVKWCVPCVST